MKIGVLGGGQLGQMLASAGQPLGIAVDCFDAATDVPAAATGAVTVGDANDAAVLADWAKSVDVVTYEFENFPANLVTDLEQYAPVRPGVRALAAAQDRWHEKRLFEQLHLPVAPFRLARNQQDLALAFSELEAPVVVKTRTGGYDGKGQVVVRSIEDMNAALELVSQAEVTVEQFVPFDFECSIIAVRGVDGSIAAYPLAKNEHRQAILHSSTPWADSGAMHAKAYAMIKTVMDHLDYVGVLALELFCVGSDFVINEMAPRVHNSGHWTIEGARTSQFENHLRAVAGLPLGSTEAVGPSVMINLIGTTPRIEELLLIDGAAVHLYGKEPRPGRKLGHVTITGASTDNVDAGRKAVEALL